jgi:hypothetical protein
MCRGSLAASFEAPRKPAAPQDEVFFPDEVLESDGEARGNTARLEPRGQDARA